MKRLLFCLPLFFAACKSETVSATLVAKQYIPSQTSVGNTFTDGKVGMVVVSESEKYVFIVSDASGTYSLCVAATTWARYQVNERVLVHKGTFSNSVE